MDTAGGPAAAAARVLCTSASLRSSAVCRPLVANHLYGPSCVSLDFALAGHGLIPEGVADVTIGLAF
jgi:hypothetical protein